jgi:hypothetical protein
LLRLKTVTRVLQILSCLLVDLCSYTVSVKYVLLLIESLVTFSHGDYHFNDHLFKEHCPFFLFVLV